MWERANWKPINTLFIHSDLSECVPALNKCKKYSALMTLGQIHTRWMYRNKYLNIDKKILASAHMRWELDSRRKWFMNEKRYSLSSAVTRFKRILKYYMGISWSPTVPVKTPDSQHIKRGNCMKDTARHFNGHSECQDVQIFQKILFLFWMLGWTLIWDLPLSLHIWALIL